MSMDLDGYVSHPRGPEGAMRSLCPMAAMRLNNSRTAEMLVRSEEMRIKSLSKPKPIRFRPTDLELFKTAVEVRWKDYDKITTNPAHGTLPAWSVKPETFQRLRRGF